MRTSPMSSVSRPLAPRLLRRAAPIAAAAGLLGALVLALFAPRVVQAQRGGAGVPPGHRPPAGLCRVWYDRVPPGRQPAPVDCASARAEAWRTGARVIVGEGGWRDDGWWDRGARRDAPWWERLGGGDRRDGRRDDRWEERRRDRDDGDGWWDGRRRDRDDDGWRDGRRDRDDDKWERKARKRREQEARRRGDGRWW